MRIKGTLKSTLILVDALSYAVASGTKNKENSDFL